MKALISSLVALPLFFGGLFMGLFILAGVGGACDTGSGGGSAASVDLGSAAGQTVANYGPDQLAVAAQIIAAGKDAGVSARDQQIAVMTAMGESSLQSLDYGDAVGPDSRGPFQQRDSWGSLADRLDPYKSAGFFYAVLEGVEGRESMSPTQVAHSVQRNADPNYYTQYWEPAGQVMQALTGASVTGTGAGGGVECQSGTAGGAVGGGPLIELAQAQIGKPYVWGAAGPDSFDCSGLIVWLYAQQGISLPRSTYSMVDSSAFTTVDAASAQPGDIVLFADGGDWGHVGLYIGGGRMIHAPQPGESVTEADLSGSYWQGLQQMYRHVNGAQTT
jgi:cell wall-associated NlpC family hydrolase